MAYTLYRVSQNIFVIGSVRVNHDDDHGYDVISEDFNSNWDVCVVDDYVEIVDDWCDICDKFSDGYKDIVDVCNYKEYNMRILVIIVMTFVTNMRTWNSNDCCDIRDDNDDISEDRQDIGDDYDNMISLVTIMISLETIMTSLVTIMISLEHDYDIVGDDYDIIDDDYRWYHLWRLWYHWSTIMLTLVEIISTMLMIVMTLMIIVMALVTTMCDAISDDRAEIGKLACKMYIGDDYDDFNDNYYDIGNDCTIWKQLRLLKLRWH